MMKKVLIVFGMLLASRVSAWEVGGAISVEARPYFETGLLDVQSRFNSSVALSPKLSHQTENGQDSFTLEFFGRVDQNDNRRSHVDIRQAEWIHAWEHLELRMGIRKVFWGVTESQHLVDIINQTDAVESFDGEDKLGQPMVNLAFIKNWGTVNLYGLMRFRERTHAGPRGRLRLPLPVNQSEAIFEKSKIDGGSRIEDHQSFLPEYALRYSHSLGPLDFGMAQFHGYNREPVYALGRNSNGDLSLWPYYEIITQWSLDAQLTLGGWLLKFEGVSNDMASYRTVGGAFSPADRLATTGGFEYTFNQVFDTRWDLGTIVEYLYDDRGRFAAFQNDIFGGFRFAFNNVSDASLLAGVIADTERDVQLYRVEYQTQWGQHGLISAELAQFEINDPTDNFYAIRKDSYAQVEIEYFF